MEWNPEEIFEKLKARSIVSGVNNCWVWQGYLDKDGYGRIKISGKIYGNHRLSAWISLGLDLESEEQVNHICNNPACWNPAHIYIGDRSQNMKDAVEAGYNPGENNRIKTHCPREHEYTEENTRYYNGSRFCRTCESIRSKERRQQKRVSALGAM